MPNRQHLTAGKVGGGSLRMWRMLRSARLWAAVSQAFRLLSARRQPYYRRNSHPAIWATCPKPLTSWYADSNRVRHSKTNPDQSRKEDQNKKQTGTQRRRGDCCSRVQSSDSKGKHVKDHRQQWWHPHQLKLVPQQKNIQWVQATHNADVFEFRDDYCRESPNRPENRGK